MTTQYPVPASLLFVPGSMPERFDKALSAGADIIYLDLEDAVAPEAKASPSCTPALPACASGLISSDPFTGWKMR